ncbi:MAG: type III PLP-dependent enzyme [Syntrophomonadaceae bacterium]|nr:type III PLP-dependent enzyme [Syntrophomonadaceae bacterium]
MAVIGMKEAKELQETYGTPLMVVFRREIEDRFQMLNDYLPQVQPYYAVKANPDPGVLDIIKSCNPYFDVCSNMEIELVKSIGVDGENLIHTHPIKKEQDIKFALEHGISWFVFDNEYELNKFINYRGQVKLLLRVSFPNPDCVVNLSYKFGVDPEHAVDLALKAREMGLDVKGLCFHVGSQSLNPYKYVDAIAECRRIFNLLALKGMILEVLDIGGGFPAEYVENIIPVRNFFRPIAEALNRFFPNIRIIAEPGRFLVANAVNLILTVIGKSNRANVWWYYVDDGLYGSFSGKVFDHCDYPLLAERQGDREQCIVAGPTCDSFDIIYQNSSLPRLEIGDILVIPSMGAYTGCSATNFNGMPPAKTIIID